MKEERLQILKMVQEGILTAEEGTRLLAALGGDGNTGTRRAETPVATVISSPESRRWLRIRVTERESGRTRVNLTVPLALLDWGMRFAEVGGVNLSLLREVVRGGIEGKILEVEDPGSSERVEIFVE